MRARIGLVLALAVLAAPASAHAYVISGRAWPGHTVRYFNADKRMARAVALAVHAWNTSGARVRLVAVRRSSARVIIRAHATPTAGPAFEEGLCNGYSDIGYQGRLEHIDLAPGCSGLIISAAVIAHEFGHILGLNHPSRGCATMTPIVWQNCPFPKNAWQFRCAFVRADDIRGAVRLYGGRVRAHPSFCTAFNAPGPPADVKVSADGLTVTWHNPALPRVALKGLDPPLLQAFVSVSKDKCPTSVGNATPAAYPAKVSAGQVQSATIDGPNGRLTPGNYCYAVFVQDQFARGSKPATTMFTIPNKSPTAAFTATPDVGGCVSVEDGSADPDGRITAWALDFGAPDQLDNTSTQGSQYHCYQQSGTYAITLTVTDDSGATATTSQQVAVTVPPPDPGF